MRIAFRLVPSNSNPVSGEGGNDCRPQSPPARQNVVRTRRRPDRGVRNTRTVHVRGRQTPVRTRNIYRSSTRCGRRHPPPSPHPLGAGSEKTSRRHAISPIKLWVLPCERRSIRPPRGRFGEERKGSNWMGAAASATCRPNT